ncbi:MAG: signal peptidase II [Bacteroidetes bacterium]|nr:signal peptidase II [Bacteroidota bacterium]
MKNLKLGRLAIIIIILLNIGCDQISKEVVRDSIELREEIQLVDEYFVLTKIENTGAFLGMFSELPNWISLIVLQILPSLVMIAMLIYVLRKRQSSMLESLGLAFIIGGGIGNIFDRIVYGSVTDFFHMDFVIFRTGIFNMADVSVMVGTSLLLVSTFGKKKKDTAQEEELEPVITQE